MDSLNTVIFYHLEKAIKTYRQFAQGRLREAGLNITVDQWLVLKTLHENDDLTQNELAERVFKDKASITRILDLLIKAGFLKRSINKENRRRFLLEITPTGQELIKKIKPVVNNYRKDALSQIHEKEIKAAEKFLKAVIHNCNK